MLGRNGLYVTVKGIIVFLSVEVDARDSVCSDIGVFRTFPIALSTMRGG